MRDVTVPAGYGATTEATLRLAARADDSVIAELLGLSGATASERLTGMPTAGGWAATDGDPETAWITPFGRPIGPTLTVPVSATTVSTIELRQPTGDFSPITEITVGGTGADVAVAVPPADADGWSRIDVGALDVADEVRITITGADVLTTRDRRSNEIVALPAAVAEIRTDGADAVPLPTEVDLGCREVLTHRWRASIVRPRHRPDRRRARRRTDRDPSVPAARRRHRGLGRSSTRSGSRAGRVSRPDSTSTASCSLDLAMREPAAGGDVDVDVLDQERTSRTVRVAPCPTGCWVVLGEGLNDGWVAEIDGDRTRPRAARRRRVQRLAPAAVGRPPNGDVPMDRPAHRHDRAVAEPVRRRRVHRAGGRLPAPPRPSRPLVRRDWSGSAASVAPAGDGSGRDPWSPRSLPSSSPVLGGHWWRWPSASVPRRSAGPDCSAPRHWRSGWGAGRSCSGASCGTDRSRTPGGRARSRTFTARACSCSPCSPGRW